MSELIGRAAAGHLATDAGSTEPKPVDLDLDSTVHAALVAAGRGDLRALANQFTSRADTHDSLAERWSAEDREQALIDSGIAAGYRGAAEMTLKPLPAKTAETTPESKAIKAIAEVLDQWQNGALVNKGGHDGIVWVEPLWPLPRGAEKIREALGVLQPKTAAAGA